MVNQHAYVAVAVQVDKAGVAATLEQEITVVRQEEVLAMAVLALMVEPLPTVVVDEVMAEVLPLTHLEVAISPTTALGKMSFLTSLAFEGFVFDEVSL